MTSQNLEESILNTVNMMKFPLLWKDGNYKEYAKEYSGTAAHELNLFYHFGKDGHICVQ